MKDKTSKISVLCVWVARRFRALRFNWLSKRHESDGSSAFHPPSPYLKQTRQGGVHAAAGVQGPGLDPRPDLLMRHVGLLYLPGVRLVARTIRVSHQSNEIFNPSSCTQICNATGYTDRATRASKRSVGRQTAKRSVGRQTAGSTKLGGRSKLTTTSGQPQIQTLKSKKRIQTEPKNLWSQPFPLVTRLTFKKSTAAPAV